MQVVNDEITSPLSAQIFDFWDPQLFQEPFQASEVTSDSNCCDYNNINILEKSGSFHEHNDNTTATTTATEDIYNNSNNNVNVNEEDHSNADLSIIFDSQEDFETDIAASIDFSSSLPFPVSDDQFDFSTVQAPAQQPPNILYTFAGDPLALPAASGPPLPLQSSSVFDEDCLSSVQNYNVGHNPSPPSCSFLGTTGLPAYMAISGNMNPGLLPESSGFFSGNLHVGPELKPHDPVLLDFQGDNGGNFFSDPIKRVFNPSDLQVVGGENQPHMVAAAPSPPALGTEISNLDDSFNKIGKLSVEQRKEKIHRYMKKRNERNFSKKIKYACRKTLADSRPRVRGRFAKNDDFGEANRQASSSHHEDDEEDDEVGPVKEEEQMVDSSDILSHISGVNSFKCNYPIQSWI